MISSLFLFYYRKWEYINVLQMSYHLLIVQLEIKMILTLPKSTYIDIYWFFFFNCLFNKSLFLIGILKSPLDRVNLCSQYYFIMKFQEVILVSLYHNENGQCFRLIKILTLNRSSSKEMNIWVPCLLKLIFIKKIRKYIKESD